MTIFGGYPLSITYTNDAWTLSSANGTGLQSWTQLFANGALGSPGPRADHTAVYDSANNRMIVFGGQTPNATELNDVWVLTSADGTGGTPSWIKLATVGTTPARCRHGAVYDAASNRMIVFLGDTSGAFQNNNSDVWVLTNANGLGGPPAWTQLLPIGVPPTGRTVNPIDSAYDPATNRLILYGGVAGKPNDRLTFGDTWVLTNANGLSGTPVWQQVAPAGTTMPLARSTSGFYDASTNRLVIFGGTVDPGDFPTLGDTWILSNANGIGTAFWQQVFPQGVQIPPRRLDEAVYDKLRNEMIVFGGQLRASAPAINETWVLSNANGITGSQTLISSILPPRGGSAGTVTVQLTGTGFQSGAIVKITGLGPDIIGANTQVFDQGILTTTFKLTGAPSGGRTVVITNPDNTSASLLAGFTIDQGGAPQVWVDIVGRDKIRVGTPQSFYVTYGNRGTTDALATHLLVYFPSSVSPSVTFGNANGVVTSVTQGSTTFVSINLGRVPAGSTSFIPITMTATPTQAPFSVRVTISGH